MHEHWPEYWDGRLKTIGREMTKFNCLGPAESKGNSESQNYFDADRRRFVTNLAYTSLGFSIATSVLSDPVRNPGADSGTRSHRRVATSKYPRRFAVGSFIQESNTFCPELSTLSRFKQMTLLIGDDILPHAGSSTDFIGGMAKAANDLGISLYGTVAAEASPYGIVEKSAYEYVKGVLYDKLKRAPSIDGVVFSFHGGMVSETTTDPEGELIELIRTIVGPDIPICCTFDLHCKVSERMIEHASAFFYNNENPHVDSFDRGVEAVQTCFRIASKEIAPVMAMAKPGMIVPTLNVRPPTSGPLVDIFNRAFEIERRNKKVININIGAGFPWQDVPDAGVNVVSVVDRDRGLAQEIADHLSDAIWRVRTEFIPNNLVEVKDAVGMAIAEQSGPTVLIDVADNPGDGTTMDSNGILRELLEQGATQAAVGCIRQPDAVQRCVEAGIGSVVKLEVGDPYRVVGKPIEMTVSIKSLTDGTFHAASPIWGNRTYSHGRTAVVTCEGIDIILCERTGGLGNNFPELFVRNGIDPRQRKILVIKTFQMYSEPHYRQIADRFIEVDAPGQATPHLSRLSWKNIPRPVYPIDPA